MQLVLDVAFVVLALSAMSLLLLVKLHRQFSHMIQGRMYRERPGNWRTDARIRYRASSRELLLYFLFYPLFGLASGFLIYLEGETLPSILTGATALVVFYFYLREVMENFRREEERNRTAFKPVND